MRAFSRGDSLFVCLCYFHLSSISLSLFSLYITFLSLLFCLPFHYLVSFYSLLSHFHFSNHSSVPFIFCAILRFKQCQASVVGVNREVSFCLSLCAMVKCHTRAGIESPVGMKWALHHCDKWWSCFCVQKKKVIHVLGWRDCFCSAADIPVWNVILASWISFTCMHSGHPHPLPLPATSSRLNSNRQSFLAF